MIFLDIESVGLTGPPILIQWAEDDGPIHLHDVWEDKQSTVELIEFFADSDVCAWNLAFDWFQIQRLHNVFAGLSSWDRSDLRDPCVRPRGALDLYLHMKKGTLAPLSGRAVRIKDIPEGAAEELRNQLQRITDITFPEILQTIWKIQKPKSKRRDGFVDINCNHTGSMKLKSVAKHLLGCEVIDLPVEQPPKTSDILDVEHWLPFFEEHKKHWRENQKARAYAAQDIDLLRRLWLLEDSPEAGDYDSELAVAVACARWRGFQVDPVEGAKELARLREVESSVDHDHHAVVKELRKVVPDVVEVRKTADDALDLYTAYAPEYVAKVKAARSAKKSLDILARCERDWRAHMDFRVVGTLSGRMSGAFHGVSKKGTLREIFTLAPEGMQLSGGDFDGFEVAIAAALFDDPELTKKLEEGKKFHALYGADVYGEDYDDLLADKERYGKAKGAVFATFYGAQSPKIASVLGVSLEEAIEGKERLMDSYPGIRREQEFVEDNYNTMHQAASGQVFWREPLEYVESMFGYKRSFKTEILLARTLYRLASDLQLECSDDKKIIERRSHKGKQTLNGACRSAMYGAAFGLLGSIARVAGNHRIQATGAQITKLLQQRIWDHQPRGIHPWRVQVMNFHDELLACHVPELAEPIRETVDEFVTEYKKHVPMLSIGWSVNVKNWSER